MPARSGPPSRRVVQAVAAAENVDPTDLQPLYDVVDPDALDALFRPTAAGRPRSSGSVRFRYAQHDVVVQEGGAVRVDAAPARAEHSAETRSFEQ